MTPPTGPTYPLGLQSSIYATAFFTGNLMPMMAVVMPLWALDLSTSPFIIGLIIASRQILVVTLSIHGGAMLDRFGPRRVIMVMGLTGAACMALFPALPYVWAAIALQMISGFAECTNWIGAQSAVGRFMKGHAVYAGRLTASARVGGFIGPWTAGVAWQYWGPYGAFWFLACWVVCGIVAARFLPVERSPVERPEGASEMAGSARRKTTRAADMMPKLADYRTAFRLLLLPAVALIVAATVMRQTGTGVQSSFYGVWLKEIGFTAGTIGFLIGVANGAAAVSALTIGPMTRRFADHWLLLVMIAVAVAAIAITPALNIFALLVAAIVLRGIGQGLNLPLMMSIGARAVGYELQGRVVALRLSFNRFGGALVPLVMGALAEFIGLEYAFYVVGASGIVLICLLAIWVAGSSAFRRADRAP